MPIKLIPPSSRSPYFYGRGTYLGRFVNRSTKADKRAVAIKVIKQWERDIEGGVFDRKGEPTFLSAAVSYMQAGGERIYIQRIADHFGSKLLRDIDQAAIDAAAAILHPNASPATRNRQVYTPISAVMRHAGARLNLRRPKGAQGRNLTGWLAEDKAFRLIEAAFALDAEFGIYLVLLLYTGCRLSEPLRASCADLTLSASELFVGRTKNGEPRRVFLPPTVVTALANHPRGLERGSDQIFHFTKSGHLYGLLKQASANAGVDLPPRQKFHILRHTFATWLRRHAGADIDTLLATGAWKSPNSARRYMHMALNEEAKRANLLPAPKLKLG